MARMTGKSSRPSGVSAYSTDGGEVGTTQRDTTPFTDGSGWTTETARDNCNIGPFVED